MADIKIAAHLLVKDEEDVIEECINSVARLCDFIFVIDNGSRDNTYEICRSHPAVQKCERIECTYSDAIRQHLVKDSRKYLMPNRDWYLALSADHFFDSIPRNDIMRAMNENANVITYDVAQYYLTEKDLMAAEMNEALWVSKPIEERIRYYTINYFNFPVAFQYSEDIEYADEVTEWPNMREKRIASFKPVLKHYQFRSIAQINKRLGIRYQQREKGFHGFRHYRSLNWKDYIFDSSKLHYFDGIWERTKKPTLDELLGYKTSIIQRIYNKIVKVIRGN